MRLVCLMVIAAVVTAQLAVSNWTLTLDNPNTEDGFALQEGYAEWYWSNDNKIAIELYLYSDQYYSSYLHLLMIFDDNSALGKERGRMTPFNLSANASYDFYSDLSLISQFPGQSSLVQVTVQGNLLTVTESGWVLEVTLIDLSGATPLHFGFMVLWASLMLLFGFLYLKQTQALRHVDQSVIHGPKIGFILSIVTLYTYWFVFMIIHPSVLTFIFIQLIGIPVLFQAFVLQELGIKQWCQDRQSRRVCCLVIGYVLLAVAKSSITITSASSVGCLSLIHTTVYALSPVFLLVHNQRQGIKGELNYPYLMYLVNICPICYIMGCPSNPLHHPQHPYFVLFILIVVVIQTYVLFFSPIIDFFSQLFAEFDSCLSGHNAQQISLQNTNCSLCRSSLKMSSSGQVLDQSKTIKGVHGRSFHKKCLKKLYSSSKKACKNAAVRSDSQIMLRIQA